MDDQPEHGGNGLPVPDLMDLDALERHVLPQLRQIVERTAKTQAGNGETVASEWLIALGTYTIVHNGLLIVRRNDALIERVDTLLAQVEALAGDLEHAREFYSSLHRRIADAYAPDGQTTEQGDGQ